MKQIILTHFTITIIVVKMYLSGQLHAPALKQTFLSLSFLSLFYWIIYWKEITTERLSASSVGGQRSGTTEVQTLCIPWIINRENPVLVPAAFLHSSFYFCHCYVMVWSVWQISMTTGLSVYTETSSDTDNVTKSTWFNRKLSFLQKTKQSNNNRFIIII